MIRPVRLLCLSLIGIGLGLVAALIYHQVGAPYPMLTFTACSLIGGLAVFAGAVLRMTES